MNFIRKYIRFTPALIIFVFRLTYYLTYPIIGDPQNNDASSYIDYSFTPYGLGKRTPLFPLLIRVCKILTGENHFLFATACIQILISAVAVFYLYKSVHIATKNQLVSSIITILYGCNNYILFWDVQIMSESLAISISAIFLYTIVRYVKSLSLKDGVIAILISLIATGIKPPLAVYSGVCLVLLILQFIVYKTKKIRLMVLKLAGVLAMVILIYTGYCYNNWIQLGTFNLTSLGPRHSLIPCLVTGSYHNYPDQDLVTRIEETFNACIEAGYNPRDWTTTTPVMELFGSNEREININVSKFNSYCIKSDPGAYLMYLEDNIISSWDNLYKDSWSGMAYDHSINILARMILVFQKSLSIFEIGSGFYIMIISFCIAIYKWIKEKNCPWLYLGVWGTITVIEGSVFLGSYNAFTRLTVYVLPFLLFGIGLIVNELILYSRKSSVPISVQTDVISESDNIS